MPPTLTYPGVYIQEIPSKVRTILAAPSAVAAFVGRALRGKVNDPVRLFGATDFDRTFGGLWAQSELGYAVQQYYLNGGTDALVVRTFNAAPLAAFELDPTSIAVPLVGAGTLRFAAENPGTWFDAITVTIDHDTRTPPRPDEFNLTVELALVDPITGAAQRPITETFRNLSHLAASPTFVTTVLERDSALFRVFGTVSAVSKPAAGTYTRATNPAGVAPSDGTPLTSNDLTPPGGAGTKQGIYALEDAEALTGLAFTLLYIPPYSPNDGVGPDVPNASLQAAVVYCRDKRAMAILDAPNAWTTMTGTLAGLSSIDTLRSENSSVYFPWVEFADPLLNGGPRPFGPGAAMCGVLATIDAKRGVWKAAAGDEAKVAGAQRLVYTLTDAENGALNPRGINCLRSFPVIGIVSWGARTLFGDDKQASEWKYQPVRRTALVIESSLFTGTRFAVFEPNDEPLWAQIRLNVGAFMQSLFRQGAFQGADPQVAYFVKCDAETTTQNDINSGIVNILVGFAPLKPAEFVVLKISQMAGNIQT